MKSPTITMELRSWRRKPGSPRLVEGLAYNDIRKLYNDREYCVICPDSSREDWKDYGTFLAAKVTDRFGVCWFRLDKHEEDTS